MKRIMKERYGEQRRKKKTTKSEFLAKENITN